MTRPGMWSHYDDGIVSGRLHRALYPCDVCGRMTACVWVSSYGDRLAKIYRSTIINLRIEPRRHHRGATTVGPPRLAIFLGLGCGCLAKFHRQVAHIEDSVSRDREAFYGGDQMNFPQGACKGVGTSTLMWLLRMPFQDRAELTEWLLGAEARRPRTDSEMKAYTDGWLMAVRTATEKGLEKARQEAMMMARMEWPERFDEEGNLKPT